MCMHPIKVSAPFSVFVMQFASYLIYKVLRMKKTKHYLFLSLCLLLASGCSSTKKVVLDEIVLASYSFAQLDSLLALEKRPIAVFLHAEWCTFCKNMEQTTFRNKQVIELLNEKFYFISFDGEQKESVSFNQHEFNYQPNGRSSGTHELAVALGTVDGSLVYPTLVILNPQYEIVFQHGAFLGARQMKLILEHI